MYHVMGIRWCEINTHIHTPVVFSFVAKNYFYFSHKTSVVLFLLGYKKRSMKNYGTMRYAFFSVGGTNLYTLGL